MEKKFKNWHIFFILLVLAAITRLAFLSIRPLHHDEGNNYYFTQQIMETGRFIYNPLNYHGPLYFFVLFLSFLSLGISEISLRLPAAIFGILTILVPLILMKHNGKRYVYPSLFLLASPSLFYYSRYSIHEIALVFFAISLVILATRFLEEKNMIFLPYISITAALMFTTKETAIIALVILFFIFIIHFKQLKKIEWKKNYIFVLGSLYLFFMIYVTLFTWFFTNPNGFFQSFEGFLPWAKRSVGEIGHIKPWYYYLKLIVMYEAPILIIVLCGMAISLSLKIKNAFMKNFSIYSLLILLVYSIIPYKMPWLIINIIAPMCVIAGICIENISDKKIKVFVGTLSLAILFGFSIYLNFFLPWQPNNLYAYVHTDGNILQMVKKTNSLYKKNSQILIASDEYWPLPFYFHGKTVQYLNDIQSIDVDSYPDFSIFIIQDTILEKSVLPEMYKKELYILRPGVKLYLIYPQ